MAFDLYGGVDRTDGTGGSSADRGALASAKARLWFVSS